MAFFLTFFLWVGVFLLTEVLRPKPQFEGARPAGLGEFQFPTATEGRSVPLIWGRVKLAAPNVVWYGNLRQTPIQEEVKTGFFSSELVTIGFRYSVGIQFALCRGEVDKIHAIWINDRQAAAGRTGSGALAINAPAILGGEDGNGGVVGSGTFYAGSDTETVNTYLGSYQTPLPAYRGTCQYVWEGGYVGDSPNIPPWWFELERIPDGLNLAASQPGDEIVNGADANPMNVLYEIMTDTDWGLKIPTGEIDTANFKAAAATLATEGNGFSMVLDTERQASDILNEVIRQIDGALFFDRSTGLWQIELARDDYTPGSLPLYDESNVTELVDFSRQAWEETTNQVRLNFDDRDDRYKTTYALAQDMANNLIQGGNVSADVSFPGVKDATLANQIVWRELKTLAYPLAKATMNMDREGFDLLPGSVFRFSWARLGFSEVVFRVSRIDFGTLDDGVIKLSVIEDIFSSGSGVFGDPTGTGWGDPNEPPIVLTAADTLVWEAPRQLVIQDPFNPVLHPRVWHGGRDPGGGTIRFLIYDRVGTSRPLSGDFKQDAQVNAFVLRSDLDATLTDYGNTATRPHTDYEIQITNDDPDDITGLFVDGSASNVVGLLTIIYIDGEFIGFEEMVDGGGGVTDLRRLWRGLFHTAPKSHAAGTDVWFVGQTGGGLSQKSLVEAEDEMDTQLRSQGRGGDEAGGTLTNELSLDRIWRVPLAPRDPLLHGSYAPASATLDTQYTSSYPDGTGKTGDDARALKVEVTPRAWRVDDITRDDLLDLSPIAYDADDPNWDYVLTLDPDGTPSSTAVVNILYTTSSVTTVYIERNWVIEALGSNTVIPSTGRVVVTSKHTPVEGSTEYTNPVDMEFDFTVTSALQGNDDVVFGGFAVSTWSDVVVFGETGTYAFDIHTALPSSGILEGRLNGGSPVTIVAASSTTGNLTGVTAADDVELRFSQAPTNDQFFDITGPTTEAGYGVLLS